MKFITNIKAKLYYSSSILALSIILVSCGSYQYVGEDDDGIYASSNKKIEQRHETEQEPTSGYYKDYFENHVNTANDIFTDIEAYEGEFEDEVITDDAPDEYTEGNSGWGTNSSEIVVNFVGSRFGYPYYGGFGFNEFGFGYPFYGGFGFGFNRFGFGFGGYPYYGGFGFNRFGFGFGFGGYPYYAYGFNPFRYRYGGFYGYPYYGYRGSFFSNNARFFAGNRNFSRLSRLDNRRNSRITGRRSSISRNNASANNRSRRSSALSNRSSTTRSRTTNSNRTRSSFNRSSSSSRNSFNRSSSSRSRSFSPPRRSSGRSSGARSSGSRSSSRGRGGRGGI